jgi:predicted dehydrogenase
MALDMTPEQKEQGKQNFSHATADLARADAENKKQGPDRRTFMKSMLWTGAAAVPISAAGYFGYQKLQGDGQPVRAALIGGGDEGGVLVGEHNKDFLQFDAVCDIRPSNMTRIFDGDPRALALRKGFRKIYGNQANNIVKFDDYDRFMRHLRDNKSIEAVVIALPLNWHARAAIDAMKAGQERGKPIHVLCEKLMAWNISQCKKMIAVAKETGSILSIGHQRHYSMLYANAVELIHSGVLGEIRHIRALWHRNNSWPYDGDSKLEVAGTQPYYRDGWYPPVLTEDFNALKDRVKDYHFKDVEQLVRWRLFNETGGGLMAELGSHQLDACSIFLGKVHPLAVTGVGGKTFYSKNHNDRDCEDHVFVTYEFPGPNHAHDKNDVVVVTYSSISTNGFEPYGECVMGTRGTLVVEKEEIAMLYPELKPGTASKARATAVTVTSAGGDKPSLESTSTWAVGGAAAARPEASGTGAPTAPVSRGYKEEMEDFAYCVKLWDSKLGYKKDAGGHYVQRLPRCHGEVAMADAIIALTANRSMKNHERIVFQDEWFKADADQVPDADTKPNVPVT